jgi:hypothetical protein
MLSKREIKMLLGSRERPVFEDEDLTAVYELIVSTTWDP